MSKWHFMAAGRNVSFIAINISKLKLYISIKLFCNLDEKKNTITCLEE